MADIIEIDVATGQVIERSFNDHERMQMEEDAFLVQELEKQKTSEEKKKTKIRKSALDKLKELEIGRAHV